jgi:hypothetical protein
VAQPTQADLTAIRASLERIARLSDGLIRIGPWGLGLDGILSWVPGLGELYSAGAAVFILAQGARAQVPPATLLIAAALMGGRTVISALPFAGPLVADMLTLHRLSARLIIRAIDKGQASCPGPSPTAIEAA